MQCQSKKKFKLLIKTFFKKTKLDRFCILYIARNKEPNIMSKWQYKILLKNLNWKLHIDLVGRGNNSQLHVSLWVLNRQEQRIEKIIKAKTAIQQILRIFHTQEEFMSKETITSHSHYIKILKNIFMYFIYIWCLGSIAIYSIIAILVDTKVIKIN